MRLSHVFPFRSLISNSLMAAVKWFQTNQYRHPETFHLYLSQIEIESGLISQEKKISEESGKYSPRKAHEIQLIGHAYRVLSRLTDSDWNRVAYLNRRIVVVGVSRRTQKTLSAKVVMDTGNAVVDCTALWWMGSIMGVDLRSASILLQLEPEFTRMKELSIATFSFCLLRRRCWVDELHSVP
ncbi:hypothetical protein L2E82_15810 [Cichorium intybus]|uniref:Uncharacterized protein n=1 Tax=Cichorium intybus TaxID=13427 RepID=A0ACB9F3T8_CICIN|nr:hypothetical protein L2E82_15810 [Cichorium intybus]